MYVSPAHWKTPCHHQNTPGQQPVVLDSALDSSVQLLLEVEELWAFVLTYTFLPRPAQVITFNQLTHFLTCKCCFVRQPQQVQWGEARGEERVGLPLQATLLAGTNQKLLNQVHLENQELRYIGCHQPETQVHLDNEQRRLRICPRLRRGLLARLWSEADWADGNKPTQAFCLSEFAADWHIGTLGGESPTSFKNRPSSFSHGWKESCRLAWEGNHKDLPTTSQTGPSTNQL